MKPNTIENIYNYLIEKHGPQGWWPLTSLHSIKQSNPTKTGSFKGYHPGDFSYPKNEAQKFEICLGAILPKNT
jgi:endonuclease-3 related protein